MICQYMENSILTAKGTNNIYETNCVLMSSEYLIKIALTGLATPYVCARQQCERHLSWLLMLNDLR